MTNNANWRPTFCSKTTSGRLASSPLHAVGMRIQVSNFYSDKIHAVMRRSYPRTKLTENGMKIPIGPPPIYDKKQTLRFENLIFSSLFPLQRKYWKLIIYQNKFITQLPINSQKNSCLKQFEILVKGIVTNVWFMICNDPSMPTEPKND